MVARILEFLYKEVRGLHEAAYLLGFFALFSQILALVRDRLFAHTFGAGELLDIYYASFRIPDLIFVLVASLVSAYVLIPFISERLDNHRELRALINSVFTSFAALMVLASAGAFFLAPFFLHILFPGFSESAHALLLTFTRIMLLQPILLGISNFFGSFTQVHHKFVLYGVTPLLYNLGIITGVLFFYPHFHEVGLIYGVVFGALLHVGIQLPFIIEHGFLPRLSLAIDWALIRRVFVLSVPRTLTLSLNQIVLLTLVALGSLLVPGSIAVFSFSFNLQSVPLAIIGASYSVAAFPTLARLFSNQEKDQFMLQVATALRHIVFWSVPAIVLFVVLRAQIVRVILGSGAFDWTDTRLTAAALALFVLSLTAQAIVLLLVRGYYAAGKTWTPFFINVCAALLSVFSALLFLFVFKQNHEVRVFVEALFRVPDISGTEVLMLPLGYSVGMLTNAFLLIFVFERRLGCVTEALSLVFWKVLAASLGAGMVAYFFLALLGSYLDLNTFVGIFTQGFVSGIMGILTGIALLYFQKSHELEEIWRALRHKIWKTDIVFPSE